MLRSSFPTATFVFGLGISLTIASTACSDDRPPPSSGGSGNVNVSPPGSSGSSGSSGASGSSGSSGSSGTSGIPSASYCKDVKQLGEPVTEISLGQKPSALGGTIAPGTYVLGELNAYAAQATDGSAPPGQSTGNAGRGTIYVEGEFMRLATARGKETDLPADTVTAYRFTVEGTKVVLTELCPTDGTKKSLDFSAVGGGLALFVDDRRELYARQ